jgi:hypothetical protein
MSTADRTYDHDTFLDNLRYLQGEGTSLATIPELTGADHAPPAGGHPLINLEGLEKRIFDAPPDVTIPLTDDASITFKKLPGGGFVSIQGRF